MLAAEQKGLSAEALESFTAAVLRAVGLPEADAGRVATLMIEADLIGSDSHGIFRLPHYVRRIRAGGVNPTPTIKVDKTGPATAIVDGDNGLGHLVMSRAAEMAIELARTCGVGWVGARRSNHAGPAALYAAMPVQHGMIGLYAAVASANHMAAWGGVEQLLGPNPIAVGIPVGDDVPLVLDIATSVTSYGVAKRYTLLGKDFPVGWVISKKDGSPITDSARIKEGMLAPLGGHKGSGLAIVLGLLAGTLNGAAFGSDVVDFNADDATETNTGHFVVALDVARFIDPAVFAREAARQLDEIRRSEPMTGFDVVRIPGDMRAARREERLATGVPLAGPVRDQLAALGAELGVPFPTAP
jgi:LDH2 family malate/lactate/ureidoglycolate dehydrogenase